MDNLGDTDWDVIISGTGLKSSLLALALSRSGKKILHVDENEYYGGPEAALSLEEAEAWAQKIQSGNSRSSPFLNASVQQEHLNDTIHEPSHGDSKGQSKLSFSRAYSLSLSPFIIYSRSKLLPALVSSKTHQQLEFQAVGSWWVYESAQSEITQDEEPRRNTKDRRGTFRQVPNGREDVFGDKRIDLKSKRQLMKFLKFVVDYDNQLQVWSEHRQQPFPEFLESQFGLPSHLHAPLLALTLTLETPQDTLTSFAIPRIARHLRSIGVFGPGFGAVIPKWGGPSEICQVACRACAVGGGIYMLGQGIDHEPTASIPIGPPLYKGENKNGQRKQVKLTNGEELYTRVLIGTEDDFPFEYQDPDVSTSLLSRAISVVSSPLAFLFPALAEGAPTPAAAVLTFPSGSLEKDDGSLDVSHPPVYIMVHSSETGECPTDQCVLYSSTSSSSHNLIDRAIDLLLTDLDLITDNDTIPKVLFNLQYTQKGPSSLSCLDHQKDSSAKDSFSFTSSSLDLALSDRLIAEVKEVWAEVLESLNEDFQKEDFMVFDERDTLGEIDDESIDEP